jgi:hypothetical protein
MGMQARKGVRMAYYLLTDSEGMPYSMWIFLSEEEARRYGQEGELVMVEAMAVWTDGEQIERFRQYLLGVIDNPPPQFRQFLDDLEAGKVSLQKKDAASLQQFFRNAPRDEFVMIDCVPDAETTLRYKLRQIGEFVASLG